jgi:hypothetical protein
MTDSIASQINKLTDKFHKLSNDPNKMLLCSKLIGDATRKVEELTELDLNLQEYMYSTKNTNEIVSCLDFPQKIKDTSDDSLIIYIKKAQIYKIYNADTLDEFEQDVGTHYRKSETGPAYEVVRDSAPQKLMIVVQDDVAIDKVQNIKNLIIEFTKNNPMFENIAMSDLLVYNSDSNTEFVVSSITFENIQEKETFIESFIMFTQNNGEKDLARKIQLRHPPSNIPNTRYYELPCSKTCISDNDKGILDKLITPQTNTSVVINNTFIIQNGNNNSVSCGVVTTNINKSAKTTKKSIKTFCKYLYETKPEWYIEDTFVTINTIETAYRDYFNDYDTAKSMISRQLNGILFNRNMRTNGITKKKLVSFDILKNHF